MSDYRFARKHRVRLRNDFERVFRMRVTASNHLIVVYGCATGLPYPRLGISVPRKIRGAVRRNRWKRLVREAFRLSRSELPPGVDLIVVPRPGAEPKLGELRASLVHLARRVAERLARRTRHIGGGRGERSTRADKRKNHGRW